MKINRIFQMASKTVEALCLSLKKWAIRCYDISSFRKRAVSLFLFLIKFSGVPSNNT